eukprot:gene8347-172_t
MHPKPPSTFARTVILFFILGFFTILALILLPFMGFVGTTLYLMFTSTPIGKESFIHMFTDKNNFNTENVNTFNNVISTLQNTNITVKSSYMNTTAEKTITSQNNTDSLKFSPKLNYNQLKFEKKSFYLAKDEKVKTSKNVMIQLEFFQNGTKVGQDSITIQLFNRFTIINRRNSFTYYGAPNKMCLVFDLQRKKIISGCIFNGGGLQEVTYSSVPKDSIQSPKIDLVLRDSRDPFFKEIPLRIFTNHSLTLLLGLFFAGATIVDFFLTAITYVAVTFGMLVCFLFLILKIQSSMYD